MKLNFQGNSSSPSKGDAGYPEDVLTQALFDGDNSGDETEDGSEGNHVEWVVKGAVVVFIRIDAEAHRKKEN